MHRRTGFNALLLLVALAASSSIATANTVVFKGFTNTSIGAATLTVFGTDSMVVSGIGGGGNDGVSVSVAGLLNGANDFDVKSPTLFRGVPNGAFLQAKAIGSVNSVPGSLVCTQVMTKTGVGAVHRTADVSPTGAPAVDVTSYKNGVGQQGMTFQGATSSYDIVISGPIPTVPGLTWSISFDGATVDVDIDFELLAGLTGTVTGTDGQGHTETMSGTGTFKYLLLPKAANSISNITAFETRAGGGLTSFTITDEVLETAPRPLPATAPWQLTVVGLALLIMGGWALSRRLGHDTRLA